MEKEKLTVHCFGTKISPKSCADLLLKTEIKIARIINEPYYMINQPPISSYVKFVNETLRSGKKGDIPYLQITSKPSERKRVTFYGI